MKRYFVLPYLLAVFSAVLYGGYLLVSQEYVKAIITILACGPMLLFMSVLAVGGKARTRQHLWPELIIAICASVYALVIQEYMLAAMGICLGVIGVLLYGFWYSKLTRSNKELLAVGEVLPLFELSNAEGEKIPSSNFTKNPTVWLFIRGNWCPLCVAQVKEMAEHYRRLKENGVEVVFVSTQSEAETKKLAKKFDVPMQFLIDVNANAAKQLGLLHEGAVPAGIPGYGEDSVFPTVLINDADGKIIYSDLTDNYRIRPEPSEFLSAMGL